jgi:hypothetical protein
MSRVLATRPEQGSANKLYLVRWAGDTAGADDVWATAKMLGLTEKQLDKWVAASQRGFAPLAFKQPLAVPAAFAVTGVPASEADRRALRRAEERGGSQSQLDGGAAYVASVSTSTATHMCHGACGIASVRGP